MSEKNTVLLNAQDIKEQRKSLDGIVIAPFTERNAKGIGYNLSPSELIYSLKKHGPLPIHRNDEGSYIWVGKNDTILTLSYEYIKVPDNIYGAFYSRVRNVSQGLGNTSTTLDAGWKGMLLLCINNPTRKRIKLQLSKKEDGTEIPCGLVTMVLWETTKDKKSEGFQPLHVDNPPMRADIWENVIGRPYRFPGNKSYNKFRKLVDDLLKFEPAVTPQVEHIRAISELLLKLKIALTVTKNVQDIEVLLKTLEQRLTGREFEKGSSGNELREKSDFLRDTFYEILENKNGDVNIHDLSDEDEKSYNLCTEYANLMSNECIYLILCDEVMQIHSFIHKYVETWWEGNTFSRLINKYILPNLSAFFATGILAVVLFFGESANFDSSVWKAILSLLPTCISFLLNGFKSK